MRSRRSASEEIGGGPHFQEEGSGLAIQQVPGGGCLIVRSVSTLCQNRQSNWSAVTWIIDYYQERRPCFLDFPGVMSALLRVGRRETIMSGRNRDSSVRTILLGVLVLPLCAVAAGPPGGIQVEVTNSAANPVPVTGAVAVDGPVEVTGAVDVNSTDAQPVIVRDVSADSPRIPYQETVTVPWTTAAVTLLFSDVPPGMRLVVEHISASLFMAPSRELGSFGVTTQVEGVSATHTIAIPESAPAFAGSTTYSGGQSLRLYSDQRLSVRVAKVPSSTVLAASSASVTVSGYFVPNDSPTLAP